LNPFLPLLALCATLSASQPPPAGPYVKEWLQANLIPLKTCKPGSGFQDLQPLKALVGGAHVVSLGEATHGTREFFQMKHRLLEFLVEEMGFNVFAMEASMPESRAVNAYVLEGKGDAVEALTGLHFWIWNTVEVLDMIRWMRRYNEDPRHARKVKFYGFDMQEPRLAAARVAEFLDRVDPAEAGRVREGLVAPLAGPRTAILSEAQKGPWADQAGKVLARFDANRQAYAEKTSPQAFELARQDARILVQWAEARASRITAGRVRDRSMAENAQWILKQEGPDARMVIWAHNLHVQFGAGVDGPEWMGARLRQALGRDLVAFGFGFSQGGFQARDAGAGGGPLRGFEVKPHPRATLDQALAATGVPLFALDLRKVTNLGTVANWFHAGQATREVGAIYDENRPDMCVNTWVLPAAFDAFLFIETTTRATPLEKSATSSEVPSARSSLGQPAEH